MSLVVNRPAEEPGLRVAAGATAPAEAEYHFLLDRLVNAATLARASALAAQWGVHPHDVLIANGWLDADDYYRALAETCGTPFKHTLAPTEAVPPGAATPRQCLASGLLKERARTRHFVLAPDRLRPNALRAVLAELAPYRFTISTPRAVRKALTHHFAPALARGAIEGLALSRPGQSARTRTVLWQRAVLIALGAGLLGALLLAPIEIVRAQTWLVHMRAPGRLWRELGPHGFVAFQVMIGGTVLSALVHPWFYMLLAAELVGGRFLSLPASLFGVPFWTVAWFDLVTGYLAAMALALLAARRRGLFRLSWHVLLMPLYWLLISAAAYRAIWQFMTTPFKWEKTEHGHRVRLHQQPALGRGDGAGSGNRTRDT